MNSECYRAQIGEIKDQIIDSITYIIDERGESFNENNGLTPFELIGSDNSKVIEVTTDLQIKVEVKFAGGYELDINDLDPFDLLEILEQLEEQENKTTGSLN
jgi:hypothetical protein